MTDDTDDPFEGLDDIRWGRMRHAYGPAVEVPELLRGLADPDPAIREQALDAMYGGVFHQGDVYPCTIATIPFLVRLATRPGLPGRPEVIRLLADFASADDPLGLTALYRQANERVTAAYPLWSALLEDPDPDVRAATAALLPACLDQARAAVARLLARLPAEEHPAVLAEIVRSAAAMARRGESVAEVTGRLARMVAAESDPVIQLTVAAELVALPGTDGTAPAVAVADVLPLIAEVYQTGTPGTPPAGFDTPTLVGALRRMREEADEGRRAPRAAALVRSLSAAYGERVADRLSLLTPLLRSPNWECRLDALMPALNLINGWRGDYGELIALVGEQVRGGDPRLLWSAVHVLQDLGMLAAPAAGALAEALTAAGRVAHHPATQEGHIAWVVEWPDATSSVGPALHALAGAADERALPMLAWALDREDMPKDIGGPIGRYGERAAPLLPILRRRLHDLPTGDPRDHRRDGLMYALAQMGPAAAGVMPDLLVLLESGEATTAPLLGALGAIGPAARESLPYVRMAAVDSDRSVSLAAAKALWRIDGDAAGAYAVAERHLGGDRYAVTGAIGVLAELGPAASAATDRLRRLLRRGDEHHWLPLGAAQALWQVTGEADPLLPVLERAWLANAHTRRDVAALWADLGPAAKSAHDLLHAELGRVRRHNASDHGYSSSQVPDDEALVRLCRAALTT
ncbi:hypothetical protein [Spongiactinospora sp. 9N601]|uniref:hypothetical protein n=1 Tax=Spongiactinospora sp. 9N601 TaxID=3375149 RepID=UPI0037A902E8